MPLSNDNTQIQFNNGEHPFAQFVRILGKGKRGSRSLSQTEAYNAMRQILKGEVEDIQLGAFLMLLRKKEESHEELAGFVQATRDHISQPPSPIAIDLDWSSYAGKKKQLPWFLLSCTLLAENGIKIFVHGASGHTPGRLYTQEAVQALGLNHVHNWSDVASAINETHFAFMPLKDFCPELDQIIELKSYLGLRSPVHTLARLLNPLGAAHSIQSIFHPSYASSHQQAALLLGQKNSAVFKGEGGEIERKPEATCNVKMIIDRQPADYNWPKLLEGRQQISEQLDPEVLRDVWRGKLENIYATQAIVGTTAIALHLLGKASTQQEALLMAKSWWKLRSKNRL